MIHVDTTAGLICEEGDGVLQTISCETEFDFFNEESEEEGPCELCSEAIVSILMLCDGRGCGENGESVLHEFEEAHFRYNGFLPCYSLEEMNAKLEPLEISIRFGQPGGCGGNCACGSGSGGCGNYEGCGDENCGGYNGSCACNS